MPGRNEKTAKIDLRSCDGPFRAVQGRFDADECETVARWQLAIRHTRRSGPSIRAASPLPHGVASGMLIGVGCVDGARVVKGHMSGTHRAISTRETLARMKPLPRTDGDYARSQCHRSGHHRHSRRDGLPSEFALSGCSQGKGLNLDAAKASAVMESVEGYHSENVELPLKLATHRDLCAHHTVVETDLLPRRWWNNSFHPHLPLLWVEGEDWLQREMVWVPFQLAHTRYTAASHFDLRAFVNTSTGLASGNHLLEAASHALCEVVERDASFRFAQLQETEREMRRVNLDTVDDADCREALERFEQAGVAVRWQACLGKRLETRAAILQRATRWRRAARLRHFNGDQAARWHCSTSWSAARRR